MEHIKSAHPFIAGNYVADYIVAHMAHMYVAGRIGEHLEAVEFVERCLLFHGKKPLCFPYILPFFFNFTRPVAFFHRSSL